MDTGGVGYEVFIPVSTFYELGDEGSPVELHIHTHVRDDAIELYGFITPGERALFRRLIAISGVGPKTALAILSGIGPGDLLSAVEAGEPGRIVQIPGIGKKTAERLVLELKDRLPELQAELEVEVVAQGSRGAVKRDVASALMNLGYKRREAERAAETALKEAEGEVDFGELFRAALAILTGYE